MAGCILILEGILLIPLQLNSGESENVWVALDLVMMNMTLGYIEYYLWSRSLTTFLMMAPTLVGLIWVTMIYMEQLLS